MLFDILKLLLLLIAECTIPSGGVCLVDTWLSVVVFQLRRVSVSSCVCVNRIGWVSVVARSRNLSALLLLLLAGCISTRPFC